jgi:hypothetical protein
MGLVADVAVDRHGRHVERPGQPPEAERLQALFVGDAQRGVDDDIPGQAAGLDVFRHRN